jgi:ABC-2 type transport system ATP-binding protein
MTHAMPLIEVDHLRKEFRVFSRREGVWGALQNLFIRDYRTLSAVDGIGFQIERGEMVGYIGPNGAGKSTTIKMLTGILTPTGGSVQANGFVPHRDRRHYAKTIGVVFGQRTQLWWDIAVVESFKLLKKIYDVSDSHYRTRMERFDQLLGLGELLHTPVRKLSLGQRMRCDLAASLLHSPPILFLDEPTIGLDLVAKENIRDFLKEINQELQTTVLLTTHDLSDIEELCSRVMIIDRGKLLFDGSLETLKEKLGKFRQIRFVLHDRSQAAGVDMRGGEGIQWEKLGELSYRVVFNRDVIGSGEMIQRIVQSARIADISIEEESIEDIIRKIYTQRGVYESGSS